MNLLFLQEIRLCKDEEGTGSLTPQHIINKIALELDMAYVAFPNNGTKMSFWKATFYDTNALTCFESRSRWKDSNTPSGNSMIACRFAVNEDSVYDDNFEFVSGQQFWAVNIHAPVVFKRDHYYGMLVEMTHANLPFIAVGDYNCLPDKQGPEQVDKILKGHGSMQDYSPKGPTFVGFPHDTDAEGVPYQSALDKVMVDFRWTYIFSEPESSATDVQIDGHRISDHYLISFDFQ